MYCRKCGELINENAIICVKCGTEKGKGTEFCSNCGAAVSNGQVACLSCGCAIPKEKKSFKEIVSKKKVPIIIGSVVAGIIAFILIAIVIISNMFGGVNLQKIYDEHCSDVSWAKIADDGSYLAIDSNPLDIDDYSNSEAYYMLETINNELGLPSSLFKEMGETSALDGRQTRTYEKEGIEVTWKYHPDYGIEVTYSKLD